MWLWALAGCGCEERGSRPTAADGTPRGSLPLPAGAATLPGKPALRLEKEAVGPELREWGLFAAVRWDGPAEAYTKADQGPARWSVVLCWAQLRLERIFCVYTVPITLHAYYRDSGGVLTPTVVQGVPLVEDARGQQGKSVPDPARMRVQFAELPLAWGLLGEPLRAAAVSLDERHQGLTYAEAVRKAETHNRRSLARLLRVRPPDGVRRKLEDMGIPSNLWPDPLPMHPIEVHLLAEIDQGGKARIIRREIIAPEQALKLAETQAAP